jgi:hypothetical protein
MLQMRTNAESHKAKIFKFLIKRVVKKDKVQAADCRKCAVERCATTPCPLEVGSVTDWPVVYQTQLLKSRVSNYLSHL